MPRKLPMERRKLRTREHIIADLSVNHVERHALLCGFSVERVRHDYGIDLYVFTYNREGETENGCLQLQLKATDRLKLRSAGQLIAVPIAGADLRAWLGESMPVMLIVYDAKEEAAYWLYVQAYFESQPDFDLAKLGKEVTVHIARSNIVDQAAMRRFAEFRDRILEQTKGQVRHHA